MGTACLQVSSTHSATALSSIAQIRNLTQEESARGQPVHFNAVITFQNEFGDCFAQDGAAGVYVSRKKGATKLVPGQGVEFWGRTAPGSYAPIVIEESSRILGEAHIPEPEIVAYDQLASGQYDCQWVEVQGIIRSAREVPNTRRELVIAFGGGKVDVHIYNAAPMDCRRLVDAEVTVCGAVGGRFNQKRQLVAPVLFVPSGSGVAIREAPLENPFAIEAQSVKTLLQFLPNQRSGHRVKVRGIVTHHQTGRTLFLRDGREGLRVETTDPGPLNVGDVVEALGFPKMGEYTPIIEDATFRRVESGPEPVAARSSAKGVLNGDSDADLVAVEGDLLEVTTRGGEETLVVQAGEIVFDAQGPPHLANSLRRGARLQLTGIAVINEVTERRSTLIPSSFRLLLRSPADVRVLQQPSWWTPERLFAVIGLLSLLILAASVWVWLLQRRVRMQTAIIREKVEREAVLEERARIAREFHDSLEQVLAGIGMQLNAAVATMPSAATDSRDILRVTENMVRYSMDEAQRFVWNLRSRDLEENRLPTALARVADIAKNGSGAEIRLTVTGFVLQLPARVENHLLRIGQEAVSNAAKHGHARQIELDLEFRDDSMRLCVRDNGCGFDPAHAASGETGHFGLLGMRERAEKLGGSVTIQSEPGSGTVIEAVVPLARSFSIFSGRDYEEENSAAHRR